MKSAGRGNNRSKYYESSWGASAIESCWKMLPNKQASAIYA